jgi:hypothetical protein
VKLWSAIFSLCLWAGAAHAASVHLIVGDHVDKKAAEADAAVVAAIGHPSRVIRRFVRGKGWRYHVRVGDFPTLEAAEAAAKAMPAGRPVSIVDGQGRRETVVAQIAGEGAGPAPEVPAEPVAPTSSAGLPAAKAVLRAAAKAHGGRSGGARKVQDADRLRFSFRSRAVVGSDEVVADHVYYRSALGVRLEVDIVQGQGVSNVVVLSAEPNSWVATHDAVTPRDWTTASDLLSRFAPETGLLSIPLGLPRAVVDTVEWRDLQTEAIAQLDGASHYRIVPENHTPQDALVAALFDAHTHLLSRVTWLTRSGEVTFDYRDYRIAVAGVVIPHRIRVERDGKLVEEVEVVELALDPDLRNELFAEPSVLRRSRK